MKIHHLNCGTFQGPHKCNIDMVCHCLLVETPSSGLVLVDTGLGHQDLLDPVPRLGWAFSKVTARPKLEPELSALSQVRRLGYDPKDVRHIILTHMDFDHIGGLVDFPEALVHVHAVEMQAATKREGRADKQRYKPEMWANSKFETYSDAGEEWKNFGAIRQLKGLPPEILLVPTFGHTRGHTAVAVETQGRWLLHAGDAYFDEREVHQENRECDPYLDLFQLLNQTDILQRLKNQDRLRELIATEKDVTVFCAHSPNEFKKF